MSDDGPSPSPPDPPLAPATGGGLDPWAALRRTTPARIGLGRVGDTLPLRPVLDLQLAHAAARDAVHASLDVDALAAALAPRALIRVRSAAPDRAAYLKRPDLGRALDPACAATLASSAEGPCDCVFLLADGLSAVALATHCVAVVERCLARLGHLVTGPLVIGPLVIATQARVALGDAVGAALRARVCVVLIGERPGLSVADSLGAYVTFDPRIGRRDSERNCVSNIHGGGLCADEAARKITWLVGAALERGHSGIALKEAEAQAAPLIAADPSATR